MKDNKTSIKIFSSIILLVFLLIIKGYFFYILKIDLNNLSNNINALINIIYAFAAILITVIFYLKLNQTDNPKKYLKTFFSGIGAVSAYFLLNELAAVPLILAGVDVTTMSSQSQAIYLLCYEIITLIIIYLILRNQINDAIIDIKKNHKEYFSKYFKYWILALIIMSGSNILISWINGGQIAGNEEAVRNVFSETPIYMFISAVFIAPLTEEFIFRQGLRNIFSNNTVFIVVSGLVFGGLHVVSSITNWTDLLYLIPYCAPGFIFAYMLSKTDNIFVSTGFHFLHNGIMMSLQILLLLLGQMWSSFLLDLLLEMC